MTNFEQIQFLTNMKPSDKHPNKQQKTFLSKHLQSFKHASAGFKWLFRTEMNARIHLVAAIVVCISGYIIDLSQSEWLWIALAITLVFMAELFNSALEYLADALHPDHHSKIGKAKDMGAAATLTAALFAVIVGIIVFGF